jgi:hypothetical protein
LRDKADPAAPSGRSRGTVANLAPYALTVAAVLLAWQVVIQPFAERAPVSFAIRIAPGSPLVLRRAAEAELAENRAENAASLGRDALVRARSTCGPCGSSASPRRGPAASMRRMTS